MNKPILLLTSILILIAISLASAAAPTSTIALSAPSALKQGQIGNMHITISSNEAYNGTIELNLGGMTTNIMPANQISIQDADFDPNNSTQYDIQISANTIGISTIYANLTANSTIIDQEQISVQITDGIPPAISNVSPSGTVSGQSVTISAMTDENAECRYSSADKAYELMENSLGSSASTIHQSTIGLGDTTYTFYIRCNDTNGNIMQNSAMTTFTILTTAYADIILNKESPITAGIIEVTVITSKNMADASLSYSFSDAPTTSNIISLAGSGTYWKGYFIVPETSVTRVGTFTFTGTDTDGRTGTRINSGKLFIVDTSKPKEITDISATGETGRIKLKWFYDGETGEYNVYRSSSSDVSYVDLYETTNESHFSDKNVNTEREYYYRIAAVTSSGNVGPLSSVVSAQAEKFVTSYGYTNKTENAALPAVPEEKKENSAFVLKKANEKIKEISVLLLDVEKAEKDIAGIDDPIEKAAIDDLGLIDAINVEKAGIVAIRTQYEGYLSTYIDEAEFNRTSEFINVKIKKSKISIPKKIVILDKSSFIQQTSYEDIISASNAVLNESQVKDSLAGNKKLNDQVKVEVDYKVSELTFLDDSTEKKTIIRKSASYQSAESAKKIMLVETIPKTVALSTDDISFKTKYIKVIKKDPIVGLELDELNYNPAKITYIISGKKDIEEIRKTRTIAIGEIGNANSLTGLNIFSIEGDVTMFDWIVLAGVVLLIALVGYYFMFVKEQQLLVDRKEMHGLLPQETEIRQNYQQTSQQANNQGNTLNSSTGQQTAQTSQRLIAEMKQRNLPAKENINVPSRIAPQGKMLARTEEIRRIVNEGHFHIDNLNYNSANQMYTQAIEMLGSMNASMHERIELDTTINSLYSKLLLMSKINEAHTSLDRNDKVSAMTLLDEIAGLNNDILKRNSNTNLAEYSSNWQNKLQKRLFGR